MAIPIFEDFLYPFMNHLMDTNSNKSEMIDYLAGFFNLSEEDRNLKTKGGKITQLYDRVGWCLQWLRRAMFVEIPNHGVWRITNRGRDYMKKHKDLRESDLLRYPEFAEYSRGKKSKEEPTTKNIHETILEIAQNTNFIKSFLKSHLILLGYGIKEIDNELDSYKYNLTIEDCNQVKNNNLPENESSSTHDTTRFSFDGGKTFYNKRLFVLKVIRKYVSEHPNITIDELEDVFPSSIISKKRGVIKPLSVVKGWIKERPDVAKRYFMNENEIITLIDGTKIVVHNQWGTHFPKFLDIALKLYDVRSDKLYHGRKKLYYSDNTDDKPHNERPFGINIPMDSLNSFKSKK